MIYFSSVKYVWYISDIFKSKYCFRESSFAQVGFAYFVVSKTRTKMDILIFFVPYFHFWLFLGEDSCPARRGAPSRQPYLPGDLPGEFFFAFVLFVLPHLPGDLSGDFLIKYMTFLMKFFLKKNLANFKMQWGFLKSHSTPFEIITY